MKAKSKHYFLLIIGLALVVATGFGYWYVYKIVISQAEKWSQLSQEIKNNEQYNKQEAKLLNISSSTLDRREKLFSYFVSDDKILDFIKSIESIADYTSTQVVLSAITAEDLSDKEAGSTGHITIHAEVKGGWVNVNKALVLIENLPYSLSIKSIRLNTATINEVATDKKKATSVNAWSLSLDISALTMK